MKLSSSITLLPFALLFTSALASPVNQGAASTGVEEHLSALTDTTGGPVIDNANITTGSNDTSQVTDDYTETLADLETLVKSNSSSVLTAEDYSGIPHLTLEEVEKLENRTIEGRQVPKHPIPHFRECRKNDPRPYCPHRRSEDSDFEEQSSTYSTTNEEFDDVKLRERRQVPTHPIPHFRECRKNDPRPYCPHRRSEHSDIEERSVIESVAENNDENVNSKERRQVPNHPIPHFRECRKNDSRPYCPHRRSEEVEVEKRQVPTHPIPHFRECRKNDPRPYCPH